MDRAAIFRFEFDRTLTGQYFFLEAGLKTLESVPINLQFFLDNDLKASVCHGIQNLGINHYLEN